MAMNVTAGSANFGFIDVIARVRPNVALALAWVAYGLFYATVAVCFIGPVWLTFHISGVWPG